MGVILRCKVALFGDATVGKSALTQMFHSKGGSFPKTYKMTSGVELAVCPVSVPHTEAIVELYIFDAGGQDIFREQCTKSWESAAVGMVVFDVTNRATFESCGKWVDEFRKQQRKHSTAAHAANIPMLLLGNKTDIGGYGCVTEEEGAALAEKYNMTYFSTSAMPPGNDVDAPFVHIATAFYQMYQHKSERLRSA